MFSERLEHFVRRPEASFPDTPKTFLEHPEKIWRTAQLAANAPLRLGLSKNMFQVFGNHGVYNLIKLVRLCGPRQYIKYINTMYI